MVCYGINKWDPLSTRENKNFNKQAGPSVNPSRQKTTIASGIFCLPAKIETFNQQAGPSVIPPRQKQQ